MDSKFVCVEFDDGDNGTIALEDIRFLPSNLPVMEYDPNPLLSLSRRKRRRSSSNTNAVERRQNEKAASLNEDKEVDQIQMKKEDISSEDLHKERKRLKKKKKEKKKRKHRCEEENCTHKKHHKKHKKHRKHHHDKENSNSEKSTLEMISIHPNLAPQEVEVEDVKPVILQEVLSDAARDVESQLCFDKTEETEDMNVDDALTSDEKTEDDDDDDYIPSPEDEVTIDDIQEIQQLKKIRNRQASCESSKSRMSAFLTEKHIWSWSGKTIKRVRGKGRKIKCYYSAIERGKERISLQDTAVFCSTSKPERPYIGQITSLYEKSGGNKYVKVKWYYHPEETDVNPSLYYAGGVFSSLHYDENDVQTISHKCKVVSLKEYLEILRTNPRLSKESSLYYLAGEYEARDKVLTIYPDVPINNTTK